MYNPIPWLAAAVALLVALFGTVLRYLELVLVFQPRACVGYCSAIRTGFRVHPLPSGGCIWESRSKNADAPSMLFLHGNSGNLDDYANILKLMDRVYHVFALEYRGYGSCGELGSTTETTIMQDAIEAWQFLGRGNTVIVVGHSLGGAVAVQLARYLLGCDQPLPAQLVLLNTFGSYAQLVQDLLGSWASILPLSMKWDTDVALRELAAHYASENKCRGPFKPILSVYSAEDELISTANTLLMTPCANQECVQFVKLERQHKDIWMHACAPAIYADKWMPYMIH